MAVNTHSHSTISEEAFHFPFKHAPIRPHFFTVSYPETHTHTATLTCFYKKAKMYIEEKVKLQQMLPEYDKEDRGNILELTGTGRNFSNRALISMGILINN